MVSSIDTCCTQSKVSLRGSSSRMFPARSRIVADSLFRFIGATIGETTLRCSSCFGGSIEMKLARRYSIGRSVIEMPPSIASDE